VERNRKVAVVTLAAACLIGRAAAAQGRSSVDSLRDRIVERVAATAGAFVAVSYIDLQTGERLSLNDDSSFHAASTMKIPVMIEVLRRSQQGAFAIDQPILVVNDFASLADGSRFKLDSADDSDSSLYRRTGERVPVNELMRLMITRSSNLATDVLMELVGAAHVTAGARSLGATRLQVLRGVQDLKAFDAGMNNTTTAHDLATLLVQIEKGGALSPASSAMMRDILLAQEFNERIPAGLPPGTRVAHKTGDITAVSHDAAIVYPPERKPYVLVVLTRGVKEPKVSDTLIADISRLVWSHATLH